MVDFFHCPNWKLYYLTIVMNKNYIFEPKIMQWEKTLPRSHNAIKSKLITNGASFTGGTDQTICAASWPGYVYERCDTSQVIDLSWPGKSNKEIYKTTIEYVDSIDNLDNFFSIIMWNGLSDQPDDDYDYILEMINYFEKLTISYAFTLYANIIFPPILPRRDCFKNFYKNVSMEKINILISKHFFPSDKNLYLYDFAFFNDMFEECQYHPSPQCKLKWTDEVLLPELTRLGLVEKNL